MTPVDLAVFLAGVTDRDRILQLRVTLQRIIDRCEWEWAAQTAAQALEDDDEKVARVQSILGGKA